MIFLISEQIFDIIAVVSGCKYFAWTYGMSCIFSTKIPSCKTKIKIKFVLKIKLLIMWSWILKKSLAYHPRILINFSIANSIIYQFVATASVSRSSCKLGIIIYKILYRRVECMKIIPGKPPTCIIPIIEQPCLGNILWNLCIGYRFYELVGWFHTTGPRGMSHPPPIY